MTECHKKHTVRRRHKPSRDVGHQLAQAQEDKPWQQLDHWNSQAEQQDILRVRLVPGHEPPTLGGGQGDHRETKDSGGAGQDERGLAGLLS